MAYVNIVCRAAGRFVLIRMRQVSAPSGTSWLAEVCCWVLHSPVKSKGRPCGVLTRDKTVRTCGR